MTDEEKKTDVPGLYKVSEGVIINKDNEGLLAYKKNKQRLMMVDKLYNEMNTLKSDMQEIKELLKGLAK